MEPLVIALQRLGHGVTVVVPHEPSTADEALRVYAAAIRSHSRPFLVAHSNAGNFVARLVNEHRVAGVVFMDAVLPPLSGGDWPVVPPELADHVSLLSRDDVAPPWTRWWSHDDISPLFPSDAVVAQIDATCPRLPLSYLSAQLHAPPSWARGLSAAYLAFGDTYQDELARARAQGWPTEVIPLGHLGFLGDAELVAAAIERLRPALS